MLAWLKARARERERVCAATGFRMHRHNGRMAQMLTQCSKSGLFFPWTIDQLVWPVTSSTKQAASSEVGDSRAVLGRCSTPARQTVSAVDLSSDQRGPPSKIASDSLAKFSQRSLDAKTLRKPARPDERQRILAAGGTVVY